MDLLQKAKLQVCRCSESAGRWLYGVAVTVDAAQALDNPGQIDSKELYIASLFRTASTAGFTYRVRARADTDLPEAERRGQIWLKGISAGRWSQPGELSPGGDWWVRCPEPPVNSFRSAPGASNNLFALPRTKLHLLVSDTSCAPQVGCLHEHLLSPSWIHFFNLSPLPAPMTCLHINHEA